MIELLNNLILSIWIYIAVLSGSLIRKRTAISLLKVLILIQVVLIGFSIFAPDRSEYFYEPQKKAMIWASLVGHASE